MQKVPIFFLCLFIGFLSISGQSISSETGKVICAPLKTMILKPPGTIDPKRPPVEFSHSDHLLQYSCKTCHHKWEGGEQISTCTGSGCLGPDKPPIGAKRKGRTWLDFSEEQIKYFKNAYHKQCIGCHKHIKLKNLALLDRTAEGTEPELEPRGPTQCKKCHLEK
jgi:hypothetical protein